MSVLFSPANPLYGRQGSLRICRNSRDDDATQSCQRGAEVWYSDWGYSEPGKVHARLTFNPYFAEQSAVMAGVLDAGLRQALVRERRRSPAHRRPAVPQTAAGPSQALE